MTRKIMISGLVATLVAGLSAGVGIYHHKHAVAAPTGAAVEPAGMASAPKARPVATIDTTPPTAPEPPSVLPALIDDRAKKVAAQFDLEPSLWLEYSTMLPEELTKESSAVKKAFERARDKTDDIQKKREELLDKGEIVAAGEMLNNDVIPLLQEREKMAAKMMLLAYAKGINAVDGTSPPGRPAEATQ